MDQNQLKILFVGLMVVLAFISRVDQEKSPKTELQENITNTSLAAIAYPRFVPEISKKPPIFAGDALNVKPPEPFVFRRDWNIPDPALKVKAALAKDLDYNFDFYRWNVYDRWALASLTKLMTAVIVYEDVGLEKIATISQSAADAEGIAGNFKVGEQYSVGDLAKAALAVSSNDAATAIAEFYGLEQFVGKMQEKAAALEMEQTKFVEPTGISFENQGSIEDLEKLVSYIYAKQPQILEFTKQQKVRILELKSGVSRELLNINNFAASRPDFFGGKTGFTDEAGGNLISIFNRNGHKILIIVLGTEDRYGQTDLLYNWVKETFNFN